MASAIRVNVCGGGHSGQAEAVRHGISRALVRYDGELRGALKKAGFRFVGPVIVYALMQSIGLVNDHLVSCYRHAECVALGRQLAVPGHGRAA